MWAFKRDSPRTRFFQLRFRPEPCRPQLHALSAAVATQALPLHVMAARFAPLDCRPCSLVHAHPSLMLSSKHQLKLLSVSSHFFARSQFPRVAPPRLRLARAARGKRRRRRQRVARVRRQHYGVECVDRRPGRDAVGGRRLPAQNDIYRRVPRQAAARSIHV